MSNVKTISDYKPVSADPKEAYYNPNKGYMMDKKPAGGVHTIGDFKDTYKMTLKMKPLSDSNNKTVDKLKKNETVPQADVTRLINSIIKTDNKGVFNEIADEVFNLEKKKHPNLNDQDVVKSIVKRFKGVENKNFIREEFKEVILPSGDKNKIKTKKDVAKNPNLSKSGSSGTKELKGRDAFEDMIARKPAQPDSGKTMPTGLMNLPTKMIPTKTTDFPSVEKPSKKKETSLSDIFDTTSNLYKKNKPMMDGVMNAFSNENIEKGSWLTEIASLSQPEIKIVNELMKFTPLGATPKDYLAIENRKNGKPSGLTSNEEMMLALKSVVNPDIIGKNIESAVQEVSKDVGDALGTTWGKLTGHVLPDEKTTLQLQSAEAVAKRLEAKKKAEDKKKYVSDLIDEPKPVEVKKPVVYPSGNNFSSSGSRMNKANDPKYILPQFGDAMITGGSSSSSGKDWKWDDPISKERYDEVMDERNEQTWYKPPNAEDYGWKDTTVLEDMGRWLRKAIPGGFGRNEPGNKQEYLNLLKTQNPELYARYDSAMKEHNWRLHKSTLEMDSMVDPSYEQNKKLIQGIEDANNALIKRAKDLKQLTKEQAEESYDIHESLQKIMKGESSITFEDIRNINSRLLQSYSPEVRKLAMPEVKTIYDTMDAITAVGHKGDSVLTVTDSPPTGDPKPQPRPNPEEEEKKRRTVDDDKDEDEKEEEDPVKTEIENGKIKEERVEVGQNDKFPRIRPQLTWGDTNNKLIRKDDEYKNSQIYNEMMSINPKGWYQGDNNKLYLASVDHDEMRYGSTYQLPYTRTEYQPDPRQFNTRQSSANLRQKMAYKTESQNDIFNALQRPVMVSQYAPMNGFDQAYNPNEFAQYQKYIVPKEFQVTYPMIQQAVYTNSFPYVVDQETGGEPLKARINRNDYIVQQRFSKK